MKRGASRVCAEHMLAEQERHALIAQASRARQVVEFLDAANRRMVAGLRANKQEKVRITDYINHNISNVGKPHEGVDAAGQSTLQRARVYTQAAQHFPPPGEAPAVRRPRAAPVPRVHVQEDPLLTLARDMCEPTPSLVRAAPPRAHINRIPPWLRVEEAPMRRRPSGVPPVWLQPQAPATVRLPHRSSTRRVATHRSMGDRHGTSRNMAAPDNTPTHMAETAHARIMITAELDAVNHSLSLMGAPLRARLHSSAHEESEKGLLVL